MSYTADAKAARFAMVVSRRRCLAISSSRTRAGAAAEEADVVQRFAVRRTEHERAGGDLVFELRRQEDSGLDPEAARLRSAEEVPAHPADPRRPHSAYGNTFTHEFQWMAPKLRRPVHETRGSSNYGQDFGNIIQFNYPGDDYKDLMAGVDEVLKKATSTRSSSASPAAAAAACSRTGQTDHAVQGRGQRDISDWANFWHTADFTLFTPTWFHKAPFEDPAEFAKRSPSPTFRRSRRR